MSLAIPNESRESENRSSHHAAPKQSLRNCSRDGHAHVSSRHRRFYQMGMNVDEILQSLPHLTPAEVHAALTYYFDHPKQINREIARSNDITFWKRQAEKLAKQPA